jgi:hypothetical protein
VTHRRAERAAVEAPENLSLFDAVASTVAPDEDEGP